MTEVLTQKLNPQESVMAREQLKLSQAAVARAIGLPRSYLSQFESGKRVLDDSWLEKIYEHYIEQGWEEPELENIPTNEDGNLVYTRDGFVVSQHLDEETLEALLDEYYENNQRLDEIAHEGIKKGLLGVDRRHAEGNLAAYLMISARQLHLIRQLRGEVEPSGIDLNTDVNQMSFVSEYINFKCHEVLEKEVTA